MDRMRERLIRYLNSAKDSFMGFTAGQKAVVVVGTAALLVAAVMVFNWASTPSYSPLFSGLSGPDASSIIDELKKEGVAYQISGDGSTIMVPQSEVYSTRIALSGKGLPSTSDTGYSILDKQGLSTSEFQQQTDFKRAMEGELNRTIEAISGVNTAIVHLAIPAQQVFSDQQQPTTASVLVALAPGTTLTSEQVQAIVRLTASSVAGLDPKNVTVTDNNGQVLTGTDGANGLTGASTQAASVAAFASAVKSQVQSMLDTVVGPGNSTITITPVLNFDQSTQQRREFLIPTKPIPPLSESHTLEQYSGTGGASANGVGGVVGSNGQMGSTASSSNGPSAYRSTTATQDNAVGQQDTTTQSAPGAIKSLHIGVVLDATTAAKIQPAVVQQLITAGVGIDPTRGDTIDVTSLPFDRTAQNAAAAELASAASAKKHAATMSMFRNIGIGAAVAIFLLIAWWQGRRRNKARVEATDYIVEQLRSEQAERMALETMKPVPALEMPVVHREDDRIRDELIALVDKQPEDVAALLRGWLVEPR